MMRIDRSHQETLTSATRLALRGRLTVNTVPFPDFTFHGQVPAVSFHDTQTHRQSQARTFTRAFRRKKRIENMRPDLGVDARSGIPHVDLTALVGDPGLQDDRPALARLPGRH